MGQWSQPIRVETPQFAGLSTSRTVNSAMWFLNNALLEAHILGYLAKYQKKYDVILFAVSIQGNHIHIVARFPKANRSAFERDFKARVAEGVRRYVQQFPGGPLFGCRYSAQILPLNQDAENYFFYSALQAVNDGIVERTSEYEGYNSFHDAAHGISRKYKVVRWGDFRARRRFDKKALVNEYTEEYNLTFTRLPDYEAYGRRGYARLMLDKLEERRCSIVQEWKARGHRFMTKEQIRKLTPGSIPGKTKSGTVRPIVLCGCAETKREVLQWYFEVVKWYLAASKSYRRGNFNVEFPSMTYRPHVGLCSPP